MNDCHSLHDYLMMRGIDCRVEWIADDDVVLLMRCERPQRRMLDQTLGMIFMLVLRKLVL